MNMEGAMREDGKVDYVELWGSDMAAVKDFYGKAFGWSFTDYGPDYAAFEQGLDGGFYAEGPAKPPLVVLYAHDLEAMEARVFDAGGTVTRPIFSFPGGRRFHFTDPAGNEMAVWSET
jgi:predicted enzyme related to lactoylglutathione lyase